VRNELKFKGLILSDDMQMKAITDHYGKGEAAAMAIKAGSDMIEYRDFEEAIIGLDGLKKAYKDKILKPQDINDRISRIHETKKKFFIEYKPIYIPDIEKILNRKSSQVFLNEMKSKITDKINQKS
jgi:beta-N-acetylhexosaminidase